MTPQIVLLSHRKDEHALAVLATLSASVCPFLLDIGRTGTDFVVRRGMDSALTLTTRSGDRVHFDQTAFWWNRRPRVQAFDNTAAQFVSTQEAELEEFWTGILGCGLPGIWCNTFDAQRKAQQKIRQFQVARDSGLRVPDTIWTNNPSEVRAFIDRREEGVIFKMFTGTEAVWQPCRRFDGPFIANIQHVRFMPAIFQEYISGNAEYRITLFGKHAFSARADLSNSRYPSDVRIDLALQREAVSLDTALEMKLRAFMAAYGLEFATFDVREDNFGEPVFLECNPMGQFLFLDHLYRGEMLRAFCSYAESFVRNPTTQVSNGAATPIQSPAVCFEDAITVPIYEAVGDWTKHIE